MSRTDFGSGQGLRVDTTYRVTWMVIDQLDSMIVDPSVLGEFGGQVRRERKVGILDGDLCRSLGRSWATHRNRLTRRELRRSHVPGQALQLQLFLTH